MCESLAEWRDKVHQGEISYASRIRDDEAYATEIRGLVWLITLGEAVCRSILANGAFMPAPPELSAQLDMYADRAERLLEQYSPSACTYIVNAAEAYASAHPPEIPPFSE